MKMEHILSQIKVLVAVVCCRHMFFANRRTGGQSGRNKAFFSEKAFRVLLLVA